MSVHITTLKSRDQYLLDFLPRTGVVVQNMYEESLNARGKRLLEEV